MSNLSNSVSNNILLSNLINIRWIAIFGQLFAILITVFYFKINIPLFACLSIIVVSSIVNLISFFTKKVNNYLSDREAFYFLLFDTLQLGILLYLTGGIYNPFALLLIAPLIISASYLPIVFSIILSSLSILTVIFISYYYISINWYDVFNFPILYTYGLIISLIISLIFLTTYVYLFASSARRISQALFQTRSALANQKKLSEVGSLSAAAVHELSTPLNTIFLILNDLKEEESLKYNREIKNEIELLKSQADRCKDILLRLSKNPQNLRDNFFNKSTLSNLIKMNFDKFNNRNIKLEIIVDSKEAEPIIMFKDELMYGIGNIIQNAIKYSNTRVDIFISWNSDIIKILINDDGLGFSKEILDKLGNPYITDNKKGMGLGIFIAKNLIENISGSINFYNQDKKGASVEITIENLKQSK